MGILVIGSSNTDLVINAPKLPKPGETVLGQNFHTAAGGKGANQAVAAARLGSDVVFCCRIGNDDYGRNAKSGFEKDGIDTSYVFVTDDTPSGVAMITVDEGAENSIVVASGANMCLSAADVDSIANFSNFDIILLQLEIPIDTVSHIAELAGSSNCRLVLNPAPVTALPASVLERVNIITPNETETELLTGIKITDDDSAVKAAEALRAMGPETVIITLGAKGALLCTETQHEFIPSFRCNAVDTTAAGDVFNGALVVALSEGKPMKDAIRFASAASAISVTRLGAQPSAPYRNEVDEFLRKHE